MRRALLLSIVLALLAPAAAHAVCDPASGERVTYRAPEVVVLAGARSHTACVLATGARTGLDSGRLDSVTIAGTWVGYVVRRRLRLVEASTAQRYELASRLVEVGVEELVVGPDGAAAWIRIRVGRDGRDDSVLGVRHPGGRLGRVARGRDGMSLLGLTLEGATVRWRNGGRRGSATLRPREMCALPPGATLEADGGDTVVYSAQGPDVHRPRAYHWCLRSTGRRRAQEFDIDSSQTSVHNGPFFAAGRSVAYVRHESQDRGDPLEQIVLSRERAHVVDYGAPRDIGDLRLDRDGRLSWTNRGRPRTLMLR